LWPVSVRLQAETALTAQNFLACDRDQSLLLPAIDELELASFYAAYRVDGHGRAAHDPQMMLTLFVYAYCGGSAML
jgi:hypothetical protein